jgi:hypothetical protein
VEQIDTWLQRCFCTKPMTRVLMCFLLPSQSKRSALCIVSMIVYRICLRQRACIENFKIAIHVEQESVTIL